METILKCNDCGEQPCGEFDKYVDKNNKNFVCWDCFKKRELKCLNQNIIQKS